MHIIFDFDGILGDTEFEVSKITLALAVEAFKDTPYADAVNKITPMDVHAKFSGQPTPVKFNGIAGLVGAPDFSDAAWQVLHDAHEAGKAALYKGVAIPLLEGVLPLLEQLKKDGHILSVATSNPTETAKNAVKSAGLSHIFNERVHGCDTREQKKPQPYCYEQAIKAVEAEFGPQYSVGVEDSVGGLEASVKACDFSIGLIDHRFNVDGIDQLKIAQMKEMGADAVIRSYAEFKNVLPQRRYGFKSDNKGPKA